MSRGLNQATLIGNLGGTPETRRLANGDEVTNFSVATNYTFKAANGDKITKTEWHRVTCWRGLSEIARKYLNKGSRVYVQGRIQYSTSEKDGVTRYFTEIVADTLLMLDGAPVAAGVGAGAANEAPEDFVPINERS